MKTAEKHFTLIELLVVIAIIGILASILYPVLSNVLQKGKKNETKAIVAAVSTAIQGYKAEYGMMPGGEADVGFLSNTSEDFTKKTGMDDYFTLCDILTNSNHSNAKSSASSDASKWNPKARRFLTTNSDYFKEPYCIRDSWGQSLAVAMDDDGDGKVDVPANKIGGTRESNVNADCVVISIGHQEELQNNEKEFIYSNK